jgi:single-stranded-DNA-specific exonuclease
LIQPPVHWIEPVFKEIPDHLLNACGGNSLISAALLKRGVSTSQAARAFLDPRLEDSSDPYDFPDMHIAVDRVCNAIRTGEKIGIWGDFDVDGQTSTSVLVEVLQTLNAEITYHIPVRGPESHGISLSVLKTFLSSGIRVLLTCDTGISEIEAGQYCAEQGVDLIITDHHSPPPQFPRAHSLINPRFLSEDHPFYSLAGVGTAFQLAKSVALELMPSYPIENLLDLVALGTLADVADLSGENRLLSRMGLIQLRNSQRMAIRILIDKATISQPFLSDDHINFLLTPRMNSIGRLGDANLMVEFLTTSNSQFVNTVALMIEGLNGQRRILTEEVFSAAKNQLEREPLLLESPVLIFSHQGWPGGVLGLVASRLVQIYHKPVVVLNAIEGAFAKGSARSMQGINIIQAISKCSEVLDTFGGHPMAAGLSLQTRNLSKFKRMLAEAVASISPPEPPEETLEIDDYTTLSEVDSTLSEQIDKLSPFGPSNPSIVLAARDVNIIGMNFIGRNREHTKLTIQDRSGVVREVIHWQSTGENYPDSNFDLAFTLKSGSFKGEKQISLEWVGFRTILPVNLDLLLPAQIEVLDHRWFGPDISKILELANQEGNTVFCEGPLSQQIPNSVNRTTIRETDNLILATVPSDWEILSEILDKANPRCVTVYDYPSGDETLKGFLHLISGLSQFAISNREGRINLIDIAVLCNQSISVIGSGLDWLSCRGDISTKIIDEVTLLIYAPGEQDPNRLPLVTEALKQAFHETAAFRHYFRNTDLKDFLQRIIPKQVAQQTR